MIIDSSYKNICTLPITDGGITKEFSSTHNGTDWGWINEPNSEVRAIQDGIVREVGYCGVSSGIGYFITLEHQYSDGTHRFSGYIHLKQLPELKTGDAVTAGQIIGIRGGSPYKNSKPIYAVHLHLYTTKCTTEGYSWNTMKGLVINPFTELAFYKMKALTYTLAKQDGHNFGEVPYYYEDMIDEEIEELSEADAVISEIEVLIKNYRSSVK